MYMKLEGFLMADVRFRSWPDSRPDRVYADRGYDHDKYRRHARARGITPVIVRRGTEHRSGLGVHRWVVEQPVALLHWSGWNLIRIG